MLRSRECATRKCSYKRTYVERIVDNGWAVPYNPILSRRYQSYINVEHCISRVGGIDYLFKCVCKGINRVAVKLYNSKLR